MQADEPTTRATTSSTRLAMTTFLRRIWGHVQWLVDVAVEAVKRFNRHRGDTLGAALAFKTLLALAPLLVVAVAVLARVVGAGTARTEVLAAVRQSIGPKGVTIASEWLDVARDMSSIATIVGTLLFVMGASRFVDGLDATLEAVFEEPAIPETPTPWHRDVLDVLRERAVHLGITLGLGLWIAVSLAARVAIAAWWPVVLSHVLGAMQLAIAFSSLVGALAIMFRVLPRKRLAWSDVLFGAFVTAALQTASAWLLELWFTQASVGAGYGATGSVVAILIFFYMTAQVFVFGAELSAVLLRRRWARALRAAA